jgi:hypothetical protein
LRESRRARIRAFSQGGFMPKLSLSRAWEETTEVLSREGRLFVPVALALVVLPGIVFDVTVPDVVPGQLPPIGPWVGIALVAALISLVGQLAVIRLSIGPHVSVGEAITHGLRRLLPYVAAVFLWLLPILIIGTGLAGYLEMDPTHPSMPAAVALILITLIGLYLFVRLILSSAVASAENAGPLHILKRSWDLTRGNWWRLFAYLLLFVIGAGCLLWAVESVVGILAHVVFADTGPMTVGGLLISIVNQLVSAVLWVIFFVLLARIYVQLSGAVTAEPGVPKSGI